MQEYRSTAAYAALTGASLLWGSSFICMKYALGTFDPMVIIFGRMFLASIILLPFAGRIRRSCSPRPGDLKYLAFMSLCEPCMYFVFEVNALKYTSASQAGMITAMLPLFVSVAAYFILKEHITRKTIAGFVLAVIGVTWLSGAGQACEAAPNPVLGNLLEVMAMVSATGYIITAKHLSARYSPWYLTMFMAMGGAVFFFPLLFLPSTVLPHSLPLWPTLNVVFLGIFVTVGAFVCYNYGVRSIPANKASAFINLIPVITAFLAWLLLDEMFLPQQFAASALVLCGVWFSQERRAKTAE